MVNLAVVILLALMVGCLAGVAIIPRLDRRVPLTRSVAVRGSRASALRSPR